MSRGEGQDEMDYGFPPARGGRGAPSMFPRKLYQILCETDPEIISWDEDGKSFHIANYEEYIEGVMPLYYRHNKLTSFQRQLNLYGFKKRGRDEKNPGHYYHQYFQRDRPEILGGVRRSYPVTSPKWVSQGRSSTPSASSAAGRAATAARAAAAARVAAEAAAAAAAAVPPGSPSSPRRKRVARFPTRDGSPFVGRQEHHGLPPHYSRHQHLYHEQQQQQQQQRARRVAGPGGGGSGYRPMFDEETAMMMDPEDPAAMIMMQEGAAGRKRGPPPHGTWLYSSTTPAVSEGVAAARLKRVNTHRAAGEKGEIPGDGHPAVDHWTAGAQRGGPYARGGATPPAAAAATAAAGPGDKSGSRDPYPYPAMNGRHWEAYREQEDSYPLHPPKGGWYDSEESGLSRLTSCDSGSSAWDEVHGRPPGGDVFDRNRAADPRRGGGRGGAGGYPHHPGGGGGGSGMMGGRPMMGGAPPAHHRGAPTSAMFPAHLMRHDRFARYPQAAGGYDYPLPPPPMYGVPHRAYPPDPDAGVPPRWRPIYNGGRGGPAGGPGYEGWREGPGGPPPPGDGNASVVAADGPAPGGDWEEPPPFEEMTTKQAKEKEAVAAAAAEEEEEDAQKEAVAAAAAEEEEEEEGGRAEAAEDGKAAGGGGGGGRSRSSSSRSSSGSEISPADADREAADSKETDVPAAAENEDAAAPGETVDERGGGERAGESYPSVRKKFPGESDGEDGGRDGGGGGNEEHERTSVTTPSSTTGGFSFTVPKPSAPNTVGVGVGGMASLGLPMAATAV